VENFGPVTGWGRFESQPLPAKSASDITKEGAFMLKKERHPNLDFFVADLSTWSLKDDQESMEHPMFSLAKNPDTTIRHYEHNGNTITIAPNVYGMPTIWDKDILIYCCSQLVEGIKQGREPQQIVRLIAYDLLVSTNRDTSKHGYVLLRKAFDRLSGVRITTNIVTGGVRIHKGFGLIEWWEIIEKSSVDSRMVRVEVKLSDWLYHAITSLEVLTLHRDYFRLDGGLERRIYELCRKHCGHQPVWSIHLPLLHKKSGSTSPLRNFRIAMKNLAESNHLPDYRLRYTAEDDRLTVYLRSHKGGMRELKDVLGV
jgi:plasmid replication initiation protein